MRVERALDATTTCLAAEARRRPRTSLLRRVARVPLYPIRFARHYRRRRKLELTVSDSLASARRRMREYQ